MKQYKVRYTYKLSSLDSEDKVYETGWHKHLRDAYLELESFKKTIDVFEGKDKSYWREI